MADGDVGKRIVGFAPTNSYPHQFGLERVEICGFGVDGDRRFGIGAVHQPLHKGLQGFVARDQLRLEGRDCSAFRFR